MKLKDITVKNIKAFIQGYSRKFAINFFNRFLKHIFEQVEYRKEQVALKSPECINNGACKICQCKTPELFYADKGCSNEKNPCYPALLNSNDWIKFKNKKSITNE